MCHKHTFLLSVAKYMSMYLQMPMYSMCIKYKCAYLLNIETNDEENQRDSICGCKFILESGFRLKLKPGAGKGKYIQEGKRERRSLSQLCCLQLH